MSVYMQRSLTNIMLKYRDHVIFYHLTRKNFSIKKKTKFTISIVVSNRRILLGLSYHLKQYVSFYELTFNPKFCVCEQIFQWCFAYRLVTEMT